jgi:hypothetical protein
MKAQWDLAEGDLFVTVFAVAKAGAAGVRQPEARKHAAASQQAGGRLERLGFFTAVTTGVPDESEPGGI